MNVGVFVQSLIIIDNTWNNIISDIIQILLRF